MPIRLISLGLMMAVLAGPGEARDLYVDNLRGDDALDGEKTEASHGGSGPVRTIGRALRLAGAGDRIILANNDEPYGESISLVGSRHSGDPRHPFMIVGNGAMLDGSSPVPPDAWEHVTGAVFRFRPHRLGPQQLFLDGRPAQRIRVAGDKLPSLAPRQWCVVGGAIFFCVDPDKLPRDYALRYAREEVGVTLAHVRHVGIADLVVQGFRLDGINAATDAREVELLRVVCRGNGRSGLAVGGASVVNLTDSLLGDNAEAQLLALAHGQTYLSGTELLAGFAPECVRRGGRVWIDGEPLEAETDTTGGDKEPPPGKMPVPPGKMSEPSDG